MLPRADVRDRLPGLVAGPLDYSFANFKLLATQVPTVEDGGLEREVTQPQHDRELSVASFNVENLAPGNDQSKFDRPGTIQVAGLGDVAMLVTDAALSPAYAEALAGVEVVVA